MIHNDSHSRNLIYNEEEEQLYWIDYDGAYEWPFPIQSPITDLKTFLTSGLDNLQGFLFLKPWLLKAHKLSLELGQTEDWTMESDQKAQLLKVTLTILRSFYQGYSESLLKKSHMINDLNPIGESVSAQCTMTLGTFFKRFKGNKMFAQQKEKILPESEFSCETKPL